MPDRPLRPIRFVDLAAQYRSIGHEIDAAIRAVIEQSAFIGGRHVAAFEEAFADYQQTRCCVGVANGTDALEIALQALDLPPGSEVLVPANTFIATAEAVTRAGHRVVFCDCDPATYTLSPADAAGRITAATRALVAVHLYGHPCDLDALRALADRHGLALIEDCAQAHGAEYRGRRLGTLGVIGTFSFYPGKNLGAYGDAGALVTNDEVLARRCRMIANHGRVAKYDHEFEGRNSRLDGLQAAILSVKLRHLEDWIAARRAIAGRYRQLLAGIPGLALPGEADWARHVYHLFVIRTRARDALRAHLAAAGIETGIHYPIALPRLRAYAHVGQAEDAMLANRLGGELLSLPMGEHLTSDELERVAGAIGELLAQAPAAARVTPRRSA